MTAKEAKQLYTPKKIGASVNDSLNRICYRVFTSLDEELLNALVMVNPNIYDWNRLRPGQVIEYFTESIMREIK